MAYRGFYQIKTLIGQLIDHENNGLVAALLAYQAFDVIAAFAPAYFSLFALGETHLWYRIHGDVVLSPEDRKCAVTTEHFHHISNIQTRTTYLDLSRPV